MNISRREVVIPISTPYFTWGNLTPQTESVWIACHGYGQRAEYFIRRFDILDPEKHYVIAPQGISRFYLDSGYQKVGASWMTRIDKEEEIQRQQLYLNQIWENELASHSFLDVKVHLLGFSQGVATISRWAIQNKVPFDQLILWAGSFPKDIQEDNVVLGKSTAEIWAVIGNQDHFLTEDIRIKEEKRLQALFQHRLRVKIFEGKHEMSREVLKEIVTVRKS